MNSEKIKRMDEQVALKRRIYGIGMTVKDVCLECTVNPSTFSSWGAGRVPNATKWDAICTFVAKQEALQNGGG